MGGEFLKFGKILLFWVGAAWGWLSRVLNVLVGVLFWVFD